MNAMDQYSAVAMQPICGYMGPCRLHITTTAIIVSRSNGDELATWLFNCIRQFNAVDCYFSFTSGRRGPFGVGEYCFELPQKKVVEIQKKISSHTGAVFAHNRNFSSSTLSASTNVSNPSKPKVPVTDDNSRSRSESETAPSAPLSSNLYPLTTPPKTMTYQNTGLRRAIAPPLPSKDPVKPVVALQNDKNPNVNYVNAMKGAPKPLPRTMKPSIKKTDDTKAPAYSAENSTATLSLSHTDRSDRSVTLPTYSQRSQVVTTTKTAVNPVGSHSDLNRDPMDYGDMVCSPHGPDTNHRFFSPPPPSINSGYSDVDYDVIRRNREMGKFADPEGAYKDKKDAETYDVPSSLQIAEDTYDVPRPTGGKFEDIPDVYEDDTKRSSPGDLYSVPTSNQPVSPDLYDVPPIRGQTGLQTHNVPSRQNQLYDNPSKAALSTVTNDEPHDLYDTPQSNQPVGGGHETYDVVPSRKACSSSPQSQVVIMPKKPAGYENIGPHGEILGEMVANQLRQDLLNSLNGSDRHWMPRPLKNVNSNFSRSCEFLSEIVQEPSKRFSTSSNYKRLIIPEQDIAQSGTPPASSWHTYKLHRRLSGSLGDVPTVEACDDDDTYVVLNKTEKPIRKPPIPAPKPTPVAASSINEVKDDGESNDMYITMNRSPSHSSSSIANTETLPKGYIRMNTAKEVLIVKKSNSSTEIGRKETSPTSNEGKRNSDLVWPTNSGWSHWDQQDEQVPSRKSSDNSEVFSPPPATHEHPIVVSKSSARPKRSILLKGVSPQPVPGQEKRLGSLSPEGRMTTLSESPDENTAPTVNADGTPRPTYINLPHNNEQEDSENNKYNIEKLKANRLRSHAYDEIDGTNFKQRSIKRQPTANSQQGQASADSEMSFAADHHVTATNCSQLAGKYENWKKGEERFNKRFEPLKNYD